MLNPQELTRHLNEEIRCESQGMQPEGIDQAKMDLISSSWGATWENIFEIIFPGAPIPDPCMCQATCTDGMLTDSRL